MMEDAYSSRLRALVEDYYHGLSTFEGYREERARLLDALEEESAAADAEAGRSANDREPVSTAGHGHDGGPVSHADERLDTGAASHGGGGRYVRRSLVASLGLLSIFAVVMSVREPEPITAPLADAAAAPGLLERFLDRGDWADESLSNFRLAWDALPPDEREQARSSEPFIRFEGELQRRLESADDAEMANRLQDFAQIVLATPSHADEPQER